MAITATELKENLAKYLKLAAEEDVYISKNGKVVAKITKPTPEGKAKLSRWFGILSSDISLEEAKTERFN